MRLNIFYTIKGSNLKNLSSSDVNTVSDVTIIAKRVVQDKKITIL